MRTYQPHRRRTDWTSWLFGAVTLILLLGAGIVGTLWLLGVNLNPFAKPPGEDPFMVRIPINARPIPAYSRVEREHMMHPSSGAIVYQRVPPTAAVGMSIVGVDAAGSHVESRVDAVKRDGDEVIFVVTGGAEVRHSQTFELGGAMMNVSAIIGRVVKRDKRAGMGFREDTFFPQGTPEGLAGATPTGMRAITLDATKLTGVHALGAGDRIDLMASVSADGGGKESSRGDTSHEPTMLAQNAIVLKPVYVRNEAAKSASLTQGTRIQNVPKYEVAIAVDPDDVIPLQNALNRALAITCITHSMKPASDEQPVALVTRSDTVNVPVTVRPIYAYDVVTREAFVSPATRALKTEAISRQQADRLGVITSLDEALGAITRQDIPAGRYLRRSDLLSGPPQSEPIRESDISAGIEQGSSNPYGFVSTVQAQVEPAQGAPRATAVGDRPAMTRFIPPGRTAFAIPWNRIYGAEHLQIGDEIDLMASYSLRANQSEEETETRPDGTVIVRKSESLAPLHTERTWEESFGFRGEPWFIASDAFVIAPVGFPAPASALRTLGDETNRAGGGDDQANNLSGPPVIIAVDDRDVEAVATALATQGALFTVAFHADKELQSSPESGTKRIVVMPEPVAPYQALTENLWQGNRRRITSRVVSASDRRFADAITVGEIESYWGRVLGRPKSRGDHLTADDFLPAGTLTGLAAGAKSGHTLFVVADREIEGLDSFETEDRIAILSRKIVERNAPDGGSYASSSVILQDVRIARRSLAGQTVLELANDEVGVLQAALADSLRQPTRPDLLAVVRPRTGGGEPEEILSHDPIGKGAYTEVIIGRQRTRHVYGGASL